MASGVWGLCVSGRKKRRKWGEPGSGCLRTAFDPIAVRADPKLGSEAVMNTPAGGFA